MKKPEMTILLKFVDDVNIDRFEKSFLNVNSFRNCKAKTIRIRQIKNSIVLDFYDVEDKKQILKYKRLLLSLTDCINSTMSIAQREFELLNQLHSLIQDKEGTGKKFYDLSKNYKRFVDHA